MNRVEGNKLFNVMLAFWFIGYCIYALCALLTLSTFLSLIWSFLFLFLSVGFFLSFALSLCHLFPLFDNALDYSQCLCFSLFPPIRLSLSPSVFLSIGATKQMSISDPFQSGVSSNRAWQTRHTPMCCLSVISLTLSTWGHSRHLKSAFWIQV